MIRAIGGVEMQDGNDASVRGIVLAGVHHWGESAFERLLPRPLLPIADSPLMCYALRWLRDAGIHGTTICANSDSRLVRRCLGGGEALGLDLCYYEDLTPRGPAGSVRDAGMRWPAQDLIVTEGNVVPSVELRGLLAAHRRSGAAITVVVEAVQDHGSPPDGLSRPAGTYVFARRSLNAVPATGYQDIKEVLIPKLHSEGERVLTYAAETRCPRVVDVESYLVANEWMIRRVVANSVSLPRYWRRRQAGVHERARVDKGAHLVGPVLIGPDTRVAAGATIVGPTVIGQGCVVEEGAVVSRSVIWDRCRVGCGAIVDQCILAFGAAAAAEARSRNVLHVCAEQCSPSTVRVPVPARSEVTAHAPAVNGAERPVRSASAQELAVGRPITQE